MILALRTDRPEAEVELFGSDRQQVSRYTWEAGRSLSASLLEVIQQQLAQQHATWRDITGIIVFRGPGSFTGLRIGVSVANALAYSLHIPIVGTAGDEWTLRGLQALGRSQNDTIVMPYYGAEEHTTTPKQ